MKEGYMYILLCSNDQYYTGSTTDLESRLAQHKSGQGANFTRKHLPVELVYFEKLQRKTSTRMEPKKERSFNKRRKLCTAKVIKKLHPVR